MQSYNVCCKNTFRAVVTWNYNKSCSTFSGKRSKMQ